MDPLILGIITASIALLGLVWGIYKIKKQPRIHVTLELHVKATMGTPGAEVEARITALNTGELPCTILDVGLMDERGATLVSAEWAQGSPTALRGGEVPFRLEGHDSAYWQVPADRVKAEIEVGRRFLGYAKAARPQRWWLPPARSQFTVYRSLKSEVRGTA